MFLLIENLAPAADVVGTFLYSLNEEVQARASLRRWAWGAIERARAMMTFGPRDHRFANLVARFSRLFN